MSSCLVWAWPYALCDLEDSLGHIIAQDVHATFPLPPFPASVKDGYAVIGRSASTSFW